MLLGATDEDLAKFFGVAVSTVSKWKAEIPEFSEAINAGKVAADTNVTERLYQSAMGHSHEAVKIFMPSGAAAPVYAPYTEHYPPETAAAIFWLKNRQKAQRRDKIEHVGQDGGPTKVEIVRSGQ